MKILIVKLSSIGDVVHTLPALDSLRRGHGATAAIDWLVEEASSGLLLGHPLLDEVIVVKNRGWTRNPRENLRVASHLRRKRYDMVLDLQGLLKSGVWVWLSRGKRRIGYSNYREMSPVFLNDRLPPYDPERHAVDRYLDMAFHAGGERAVASFPVHTEEGDRERAAGLLEGEGLGDGAPFFTVCASARWTTKLWGEDRFASLISMTGRELGLRGVMVGSPAEREKAGRIAALSGADAVNLAGRTNLRELASLLRLSRFMVTVDSGPMHVAAAVGTPVVAVFGPTAPWRTGPYGDVHTTVRRDLPCSPCFSRACEDPRCMEEVTAEEVFEEARRLWLGPASGRGADAAGAG